MPSINISIHEDVHNYIKHILFHLVTNPLQYSCLENSMDGGASYAIVHGVAESDATSLSFFLSFLSFYCVSTLKTQKIVLNFNIVTT